jgi:hypothetical protein
MARRNETSRSGTPRVSRWAPCVIALLLLAASAGWCATRSQARGLRTRMEVYARPVAACYQGQPRREVLQVQLWPGGPGLKVTRERQIHLPRLEDQP